MTTAEMSTTDLKVSLRAGPYVWPGGYPVHYLTDDGGTLHPACVRGNFREVLDAIRREDSSGWRVVAAFVNWEDPCLHCDHCGKRQESAYAEEEEA